MLESKAREETGLIMEVLTSYSVHNSNIIASFRNNIIKIKINNIVFSFNLLRRTGQTSLEDQAFMPASSVVAQLHFSAFQ